MNKKERLIAICKILLEENIETQEQLVDSLERHGYLFNQSTISRDLKSLGIERVKQSGTFKYKLPIEEMRKMAEVTVNYPLSRFNLRAAISQQGAVIFTPKGMAKMIALEIEKLKIKDIVGTIADEDTILLLHKEGSLPQNILATLKIKI